MSKGKLLNTGILKSFKMHPRDVLHELIEAAANNSIPDDSVDSKSWSKVVDNLTEAYNNAPPRRP